MKKLLFFVFCLIGSLQAKSALIFGVTGQDGAYLTEFLLKKNYVVHGVKRRSSSINTERVDRFYEEIQHATRFIMHYGDVTDGTNVFSLIQTIRPDEIYNLAAQSHVRVSFDLPCYTAEATGLGALHILEAIRSADLTKKTKFYQASSSELYGLVQEIPQTETTPFYPRSPYATAKLFAYWSTVNYRESYGMFAVNGILFNHESPLRGETFVTRKITMAACRRKLGLTQDPLCLGNLEAMRDWGDARDYVEAMWLMLQQEKPEDFVIATGETHSVREAVEIAYAELGMEIEWQGTGIDEIGIDRSNGEVLVKVDPRYFRPNEVDFLLGNAEKAERLLGWKPQATFRDLICSMVASDYRLALKEIKSL